MVCGGPTNGCGGWGGLVGDMGGGCRVLKPAPCQRGCYKLVNFLDKIREVIEGVLPDFLPDFCSVVFSVRGDGSGERGRFTQ